MKNGICTTPARAERVGEEERGVTFIIPFYKIKLHQIKLIYLRLDSDQRDQ